MLLLIWRCYLPSGWQRGYHITTAHSGGTAGSGSVSTVTAGAACSKRRRRRQRSHDLATTADSAASHTSPPRHDAAHLRAEVYGPRWNTAAPSDTADAAAASPAATHMCPTGLATPAAGRLGWLAGPPAAAAAAPGSLPRQDWGALTVEPWPLVTRQLPVQLCSAIQFDSHTSCSLTWRTSSAGEE